MTPSSIRFDTSEKLEMTYSLVIIVYRIPELLLLDLLGTSTRYQVNQVRGIKQLAAGTWHR